MHNYFEIQDRKIYYKVEGTGKAIVLLHGFPFSLHLWDDFSRELSNNFKVLTIDLPGFGDSDMLSEIHTMGLMAQVVKTALDINDIKKCIMVGHSMGGYVTLQFAEKYPEMLSGFGLFHSHSLADTTEGKENRNRIIETVKKNHKNFLNSFIPELFIPENVSRYRKEIDNLIIRANKMSKEAVIAGMAGMREREGKLYVLRNAKCPVLFIFGRGDKRLPIPQAIEQAALPFTSEILILGNASHMGFIECREETLITIKGFAQKYL